MEKPRTIIADDHAAVRAMLHQIIEPCALVIFEAGNGAEALEAVEKLQPELLILDVSMPKMGGFEVLRSLRSRSLAISVVMVSEHKSPLYTSEARALGASDYLLKSSAARELPSCIQRLFACEA